MKNYDLIIIGGSAAATAAAIYGKRRGLDVKIITKEFGGEVATSGEIGNWPGDGNTDGIALAQKFKDHLKLYNIEPEEGVEVEKITKLDNGSFCITAKTGISEATAMDQLANDPDGALRCDYTAKAVIVTTGLHPKPLNVTGEKDFRNRGLSYCSTCDMPLFMGKTVTVIGGGNSALEAGLMGADIASKVYVINKNPQFKGDQILLDNLQKKANVEIIYNAMTKEITGDKMVTAVKYELSPPAGGGQVQELKTDGVFIHIGNVPNSGIVPLEVAKNNFGEIIVNGNCETNVPGLYAAGDVTNVPFKQIVIAAGQGCIAALSAVQYLNRFSAVKSKF